MTTDLSRPLPVAQPADGVEALRVRLEAFVVDRLGTSAVAVVDLHPIGVGRSRDNWVFDVVRSEADGTTSTEPLVLRCDPEGGLVDTDRSTEFAVLRALGPDPVPSPEARWLDADGRWFGRPSMVMHREVGTCDYTAVNGERPLADRVDLARRFCDLLAVVHAADWRALGLSEVLPDPGSRPALHELDRWEAILRQDQVEAWPELDLAIGWLREHAPSTSSTVLVHSDFKSGNILLDGDRIVALLDWELAHLGDPLEDLGWVTQPLRSREHLIAGVWERADLVAHYTAVTGTAVDPQALDWWVTFSTLKTAIMQVSGLRAFLDARSDEPFRPTRRVLSALLDDLDHRS